PDVIRKLDFYNRLTTRCRHPNCTADDKRLLDRSVKYTVVTKFLSQRGGLAKYASESTADILSVEQTFGMFGENFLHGKQRAIHHERHFFIRWCALSFLFGDGSRRKIVIKKILRFWIFGCGGAFVIFLDLLNGAFVL